MTRNTRGPALRALIGITGLTVLVAGCQAGGAPGNQTQTRAQKQTPAGGKVATTYSPAQLAWGACTDLPAPEPGQPAFDPALECAKLKVPLDYARPDGDTIELAVIRLRGTGPASTR